MRLYRCNALFVPRALAGFCLTLFSFFVLCFCWGVVQDWLNVVLFLPSTFIFLLKVETLEVVNAGWERRRRRMKRPRKIKGHELREGARNGGKLRWKGFFLPSRWIRQRGRFLPVGVEEFWTAYFVMFYTFFTCFPLVPSLSQMLGRGLLIEKCSTSCCQLSISKLQIPLLKWTTSWVFTTKISDVKRLSSLAKMIYSVILFRPLNLYRAFRSHAWKGKKFIITEAKRPLRSRIST